MGRAKKDERDGTMDVPNQVTPGGTRDAMPQVQTFPGGFGASNERKPMSIMKELKRALTPEKELKRKADEAQSLMPKTWM